MYKRFTQLCFVCLCLAGGGAANAATNLTLLSGDADVGTFDDLESWAASPDNQRVIYIANEDDPARSELYMVEYANPGASTKLSGTLSGSQQVVGFTLTEDGQHAVFLVRAGAPGSETEQLFSARANGTGSPVELTSPVAAPSPGGVAIIFRTNLTGTHVIHSSATAGGRQLFSVPVTGGTTETLSVEAAFIGFDATRDGSTVVYFAGDLLGGPLNAVPVAGGTPVSLSGAGESVYRFTLTADSQSVVYAARLADTSTRVVSTSIAGAFIAELDTLPVATSLDSGVFFMLATQDSQRVVYNAVVSDQSRLNSIPVTGGTPDTIDTDDFPLRTFQLSNDSGRVIYTKGDPRETPGSRLYSDSVTGGDAVELSSGLPDNSFFISQPTFDSRLVIFGRGNVDGEALKELYSVPIVGGLRAPANAPLQADGEISFFFPTFDSRSVIYIADQNTDEQFEAFIGPAEGGTSFDVLNDPLATGGDVLDAFPTPDSSGVVYRADQDTDDVIDLFLAEGLGFSLIFADGFEGTGG